MKNTERVSVYGRLPKSIVKEFKKIARLEDRSDNKMLEIALKELIKSRQPKSE